MEYTDIKKYTDKITLQRERSIERTKITCSMDTANYARKILGGEIDLYESAIIIMSNIIGETIGWAKISQGGISRTVVDVRLIAKYAIETLATNIVLVHNHPSGSKKPSREDNTLTKQVKQALQLFDILLQDHVILTSDEYYSYADEGEL